MYRNIIYSLLIILCLPIYSVSQELSEKNQKLLIAAYEGDTKNVIRLLLDSADVNCSNAEGITPLMYASEKGHLDIVKILLYNKADPNKAPLSGKTALISAVINNHIEVVYHLLLYGADINAKDEFGATALMYASALNYYDMTEYLLMNRARTDLKAQDGSDALHCATYFGNSDIISLLIKYKADINSYDLQGFSPLSITIQNADFVSLDTLMKYNADPTLKIHKMKNAIDYARIINQRNIIKSLKKYGLKGSALPYFNTLTLHYNVGSFNTEDYFMGMGLGIFDSKYNFSTDIGFNGRLLKKRILLHQSENIYYQLWEKRYYIYLKAEKLFCLPLKNHLHRHGFFISAKGFYSFGNYRGINLKANDKFSFAPGAGYAYMFKNFFLKASYEYANISNEKTMNHWLNLTAGISMNLSKNNLYKKIYWL